MSLGAKIGRRELWTFALIGLSALCLRLFYLSEISASPLFAVPVVDARTYVDEARYLSEVSWAGQPKPFWQPPLYPYLLGLFFAANGENYYLPRLFQALLGALVCGFTYLLGLRLFPPAVAIGAGLAAVFYGPLIYFGGELLPTVPAILLNLLLLLLLTAPLDRRWPWSVAGFMLGLAALAVANILLFVPALFAWLWRTRVNIVQRGTLFLLGATLAIAPVALRNYLVGDDWVLISHNAGINFYIGNNPDYQRTVNIRPGKDWLQLVEMPERQAGIERPSAKSRFFFARAWDYAWSDPLGYAQLQLYKLYLFWHGDEIKRNIDPYFARRDSVLLSALLWKQGLAFPFGLVGPLALFGLVLFARTPAGKTEQGRLLLLFTLTYMTSVVLFFVTSRYRLPAVPLLLLYASFGVYSLWGTEYRRKALLALPVLALMANIGAGEMNAEGEPQQHFWLGYAYENKGMPANAMRLYRRVLKKLPDHDDALLRLAALHVDEKEYREAVDLYRKYLEFYPEADRVRYFLGNALLHMRGYQDAIATYQQVAAKRPDWAAIHGRLGYAYLMTGRLDQAAEAYRRTLALNPDSTLVRYQLARLYESEGQLQTAAAEYRTLLEQAPAEPQYHIRLADLLIEEEVNGQMTVLLEQTPRTQQAEVHLRRAIDLDPNRVQGYWSMGLLLARQNRYREALVHFEKIAALTPQDPQVHACLGNLYERLGSDAQAQERFERYNQLKRERRLQGKARAELEKNLDLVQQILGQ
jgi:tetratricopeptide (TPR) repeat protein